MSDLSIGSAENGLDESVSIAVVTAVADRREVPVTELPPLYEWIDPDSLDALFEPTRRHGSRSGSLEFDYDGHDIVVEVENGLEITIDGTAAPEPISASRYGFSDDSSSSV
ncbi:HalOD1 output domain-containing protein [Natronorubrum daqingense]|uniref:Halobacterial output domain-containing protein n=1 Tax=Natronorubrum daqingense TaxID=588898 RepID=A0A1N6ZV27_9EURY|nr:HalOD1 output domain-containing protein [Natronorubrum daqingense]APX95235.1 hypothetical protein BB347_00675 [Natronorubrum daqingense]SIR30665.1 hypothetical protein SAMN05421809_0929 [Natronorubrum daqingense]